MLNFEDEKAKVFEIAIQLGAILAVVWEFRARITNLVTGLSQDANRRLVLNLAIAFIPAAVLGFFFIRAIKTYLFHPIPVAIALIVGGLVIFWVEARSKAPRVQRMDDMRWQDALKIGFAQAVSLIPGTSRSGATIMGGMWFGLSRQAATEFSFFLAIPTMFAATFYDVYKNRGLLQPDDFGVFAVGFIAAFVSALIAVKALIRYVAHHSFNAFAWYRIVFGVIVLGIAFFAPHLFSTQ